MDALDYTWPLDPGDVIVGREFGPARDLNGPQMDHDYMHEGIDLNAPAGAEVRVAAAGVVTLVLADGDGDGEGNSVWVRHSDAHQTRYHHMRDAPDLTVGEAVHAGQVIGHVGSSGNASGAHLCFMTIAYGTALNPRTFMRNRALDLQEAADDR